MFRNSLIVEFGLTKISYLILLGGLSKKRGFVDVLKNSQPSKTEPGANANLPPMMAPPMMPPPMISNPMVPTNPMIPGRYATD